MPLGAPCRQLWLARISQPRQAKMVGRKKAPSCDEGLVSSCGNSWFHRHEKKRFSGHFRILKWRYVSTIFLAIFSGDIHMEIPIERYVHPILVWAESLCQPCAFCATVVVATPSFSPCFFPQVGKRLRIQSVKAAECSADLLVGLELSAKSAILMRSWSWWVGDSQTFTNNSWPGTGKSNAALKQSR